MYGTENTEIILLKCIPNFANATLEIEINLHQLQYSKLYKRLLIIKISVSMFMIIYIILSIKVDINKV